MFKKLLPLLLTLGLDIKITMKDKEKEILRVIFSFKTADEDKGNINLTPLVFEATSDELDEGVIDSLIEELKVKVPAMASQVNVLVGNLEKVLKEKTDKASGKKTTTATKKPVEKKEPDLFAGGDKKPVEKKAETKPKPKKEKVVEEPVKAEVVEEKVSEDLFEAPEETETVKEEVVKETPEKIVIDGDEEEDDDFMS